MKNYFSRILIPVFFNKDAASVVSKAIVIANEFGCDTLLLHVQSNSKLVPFLQDGHFTKAGFADQFQENERSMEQLVDEHRAGLADGLLISSMVVPGNWQAVMKEVIITQHIDLVMIPGHTRKSMEAIMKQVNINRLSQQTQCPVLTLTGDFDVNHLHNIVVPVNDFLPVRKLTAATFLAKKFNAMVHLLGQRSNSYTDDKLNTICLTKAYQLLSEYTNVKIHCTSDKSNTLATDTLEYARKVQADLIVVNPGKESLLSGLFNRWLPKDLHRESNIPVLTISPQPYL